MSACCDSLPTPSPLKTVEQALALLLEQARPLGDTETLPLDRALGRVLATPIHSRVDVAPWDNSAMDGYAVRIADLGETGATLPVSQRIPAGAPGGPLAAGTAARIFTGAPLPEGADAVVMQEVCERQGDRVRIGERPRPGANIRRRGEDIRSGERVLEAGTRLLPQQLGLAASVGVAEVEVVRRLRVALFASGDELAMPGSDLGPGQIYNSNQFTLGGLLQALGCEVQALGIVEDTLEATTAALERAAAGADLVLASGGVSVGEEDHVKPAVERLGRLDLWRIAVRPGKPLAFGHIGETPFIGSPGNPVSLFVTFCLFARPFIRRMQGVSGPLDPLRVPARAAFAWPKAVKRREYARARLGLDDRGEAWIELYPSRSSAVLSSVVWAGGLAEIPEGCTFERGERILFLPFEGLLA